MMNSAFFSRYLIWLNISWITLGMMPRFCSLSMELSAVPMVKVLPPTILPNNYFQSAHRPKWQHCNPQSIPSLALSHKNGILLIVVSYLGTHDRIYNCVPWQGLFIVFLRIPRMCSRYWRSIWGSLDGLGLLRGRGFLGLCGLSFSQFKYPWGYIYN